MDYKKIVNDALDDFALTEDIQFIRELDAVDAIAKAIETKEIKEADQVFAIAKFSLFCIGVRVMGAKKEGKKPVTVEEVLNEIFGLQSEKLIANVYNFKWMPSSLKKMNNKAWEIFEIAREAYKSDNPDTPDKNKVNRALMLMDELLKLEEKVEVKDYPYRKAEEIAKECQETREEAQRDVNTVCGERKDLSKGIMITFDLFDVNEAVSNK